MTAQRPKSLQAIPVGDGREYLRAMPTRDQIPAGRVVVHNHVYPVARRLGWRGSRAWLAAPDDRLVACDCGWAPELGGHYRVAAAGDGSLRKAAGK